MNSSSVCSRTTIVTEPAWSARNSAAWPAEFPPPTTATASPAQMRASIAVAAWKMHSANSSSRGTGSLRYRAPVATMTASALIRAPPSSRTT